MNTLLNGKTARGAIGFVVFFALWEACCRIGVIDPDLLPPASVTLARAAELAVDAEFLGYVGETLVTWAIGLLVAAVVAIPLGALMGSLRPVEKALRPLVEFLRPIPAVSIIPLAMLLISDVQRMQITIVVYAATWPMLINTIYGMHDVDKVAKETLRSFGFSPAAVVWRVSLPSAAPFIATGVRLSAAIALIAAISAQLLGPGSGIGGFLIQAQSGLDSLDTLVAAALWAGLLGVVTNAALALTERRMFRWHIAKAKGGRA
ncbi:ABC transporter permease [Bailinhaonella thermotolerans]|uniref:ABC transporter permease n=1 Tax=Bailinhaonella thermotolerans TaxID=1070861 RepID=A0A3A4AWF7_9ACTN|nr:ABC transporter permease [Bailinhaonella thermotolerans]RJL31684.1 ABC transporter permease [Bailinhaonella thermotolerans]